MSFAAIQSEFAGFPESDANALASGNLVDIFMRLYEEKGGLIPQAMLGEVLGVSKQRVSQLLTDHRFEVHQLGNMRFITGDSLATYFAEEKKVGRGHKAPRFMTVYRAAQKAVKDALAPQEEAA